MRNGLLVLMTAATGFVYGHDLSGKWVGSIDLLATHSIVLIIEPKQQERAMLTGRIAFGTKSMFYGIENIQLRENNLRFDTAYAYLPMAFDLKVFRTKLEGYALYGGRRIKVQLRGPVIIFPIVVKRVRPEYTEEGRRLRNEGVVVLRVAVSAGGKPVVTRVLRPLGNGLDEKAIQAVQRWHFRPGRDRGVPALMETTVEVEFRLH